MQFIGRALLASAFVLGACGGDRQATTADTAAAPATTTGAAPAGATTGAPVTGTTHRVDMVITPQGEYRYVPANITVKQGDAISFVNVSGGPHNVAFDNPDQLPANVRQQLDSNMPGDKIGPLTGPLLTDPNATYVVSFGNVAPGTYDYHCTPHLSFGMVGKITVQ